MRKEEEFHRRIVEMETERSLKRLDEARDLVEEAGQELGAD
jgi:primosomal protein N''